jgi:outer membrane protein
MNRLPIILSSLALLGVIILAALHLRSNKATGPVAPGSQKAAVETNLQGSKIAYIDIDTFEANYESLKAKKAEFDAQKNSMEGELQRSAQQFQNDLATTQRKYQEGTLTQAEAESAQKRLGQMQQTLKAREESMSKQFSDKLEAFNKELHERMNTYLSEYAEQHGLDYVFSYSESAPVLMYGKPALNITQEVIKGMNERAKASGEAAKSK